MEAIGLPIAIFHAFNTVIEDIVLLHAVKDSGDNFKINLTRLGNIQVQLSRWSKAVGLAVDRVIEAQFDKLVPREDQVKAKQTLDCMIKLLEKAKERSSPYDTSSEPETDMETLMEETRRFSLSRSIKSRSKEMSILKKTKWALYEKGIFEELLDNIAKLMADLEMLFPSNRPASRQLADEELRELGEQNVRRILKHLDAWKPHQDKILEEALTDVEGSKSKGGTTSFGNNNLGVQVGRDAKNSTFTFSREP